MTWRQSLLLAAMLATPMFSTAQPSKFDGAWNVTLTCPPHHKDDDAKGYTHRFPAEIVNGRVRGIHGQEGEPGWHLLTGSVAADGSATLRLDGIVNNEEYAINNAERGKSYRYRVHAQFEQSSGTGERLTGRTCHFRFSR